MKRILVLALLVLGLSGLGATSATPATTHAARTLASCIHYCAYINAPPYWCGRDHQYDYAYLVQEDQWYICLRSNYGPVEDYDWFTSPGS